MADQIDRRKRAIPDLPRSAVGTDRAAFDASVKANLEVVLGRVRQDGVFPEPLGELAPTATTLEVIEALNAVIRRLR